MSNDFGVSPLTMLEILSPLIVLGPAAMSLLVFGPFLIYPIARWKGNRAGVDDPQLGLKFLLNFFSLQALQITLLAIALVFYALIAKGSSSTSEMLRSGFGFLIPAAGVLAVHVVVLRRTNQDQYPIVRRLFLGYNVAITGFIGFAMLVFAFQVLFAKGSAGNAGRFAIVGLIIYVGAWVACGYHFVQYVLGKNTAGGPPANIVTPPQASAGLPPLSAGQYPPLEPR